MGREWPLLQSHTTQFLPESPTLIPSKGGHIIFILGTALPSSALQEQAQYGGAPGTCLGRSKEFLIDQGASLTQLHSHDYLSPI